MRARHVLFSALTLSLMTSAMAQDMYPVADQTRILEPEPSVLGSLTLGVDLALPAGVSSVVVAQSLPKGVYYIPGSSRLGGLPLVDPVRGKQGVWYWAIPIDRTEELRSLKLTFSVDVAELSDIPEPSLELNFGSGGNGRWVSQGNIDRLDLEQAKLPSLAQNMGRIKMPLQGSVFRDRDQVSATVEGRLDEDLRLFLNGEPVLETQVGRRVENDETNTLTLDFVGLPLKEGKNELRVGQETIEVFFVGVPVRFEVIPIQLQADGFTPLELKIRALDAQGLATRGGFVTLDSNLEPLDADANPKEGGYQLQLIDGEATVKLRPQTLPVGLDLSVALGTLEQKVHFDVRPKQTRVALGMASLVAAFDPLAFDLSGRGYFEGPIGDGKLYIVAAGRVRAEQKDAFNLVFKKQLLPTDEKATTGYTVYGDAAQSSAPIQGIDPIALRYEHPSFRLQYAQDSLPIDALTVGGQWTALSVQTLGDVAFSGFAAAVPDSTVRETLNPDGTRLLRLKQFPMEYGSESIEQVVRDATTGAELSRKKLERLKDYTLDSETGLLEFARPPSPVDTASNPQVLEVVYRSQDPMKQRFWVGGAQLKANLGQGWTASAATVSLRETGSENVWTSGGYLKYAQGKSALEFKAAWSDGYLVSAFGRTEIGGLNASLQLRDQQKEYGGVGRGVVGRDVTAEVQYPVAGWTLRAKGNVSQRPEKTVGSAELGADYKQTPLTFGFGAQQKFLDESGTSLTGQTAYDFSGVHLGVNHTQKLNDGSATSEFSARYALTPQINVVAQDSFAWGVSNRASVGLENRFGNSNFKVSYDLPNGSDSGNRARFGADTLLNLSPQWSLNLGGNATLGLEQQPLEWSATTSLRYAVPNLNAGIGVDVSRQSDKTKWVFREGLTGDLGSGWSVGLDGLSEVSGNSGNRFAVSLASRQSEWNALGYVRFSQGSFKQRSQGEGEWSSQLGATWHQPDYQIRTAVAGQYTLGQPESLMLQPQIGLTANLIDPLAVGVYGRALYQPAIDKVQYGLSLEGTWNVLSGLGLTLGYNPTGFEGLGGYTRKGVYVRVDVLLDERGL
ncbi:MAG: hypothetical protein U0Z75_05015 [Deinococcaceae bacterium]